MSDLSFLKFEQLRTDEEYVDVNWRISFSSHAPEQINWSDAVTDGIDRIYDMTEPNIKLEHMQHKHDVTGTYLSNSRVIAVLKPSAVGLVIGHRIDEDAHPRRMYVFGSISYVVFVRL